MKEFLGLQAVRRPLIHGKTVPDQVSISGV
jgi:hypothetical protein